ncbi:IclR family transcriptional regulator [Paenibacillus paeoniae]|uniref:IclR family transcriptional regulator n=1 Tax=Paenibacillus paeoniae TaxID=2292705 RepID=A0A371PII1_9BACL|nr:IclR family transcriptional regulator [Paenibacillus paeoniae]REK76040.1 IclR family transcriptional regulator [Paenibacillus paeoniae]
MNGTQTLGRAIDILFALAESGSTLTVSEIAERVGIPDSTAYRFIQTLIKNGFVERKGRGQIGLGLRIFDLARSLSQQIEKDLLTIARPIMEELTNATGETTVLFVRSGSKAICIENVTSKRLIRLSIENGRVLPLNLGASGKTLLAYESDKIIEEMCKLFSESAEGAELLYQELEAIRGQGYSYTLGEYDSDAFAVAAPILDPQQRIVASLSAAGPIHRLNKEEIPSFIEQVKDAASQISCKLGGLSG